MTRPSRLALAAVLASTTVTGGLAAASAAGGGLSITPAVIEKTAARGVSVPITIVNTSGKPLRVTVTPRPWAQARSGAVTADRRRTLLSQVGVSVRAFDLPTGGRRTVTIGVRSVPRSGSIYGSVETVGLPPARRGASGVNVGYRLISTLRLDPAGARRRVGVRGAAPVVHGRSVVMAVRNTGNTVAPVSGTVRITGSRGSRSTAVRASGILPGSVVDLGLGSTRGLPPDTYTVAVTLTQDGHRVLRSTRRLRIR